MPPKRLGVILAGQRAGTTALGKLLGTQRNTVYLGEIFHAVRGPQDDLAYEKFQTVPEANFFTFRERMFTRFPALAYPSDHNQGALWSAYVAHVFSLFDAELFIIDIKYNSLHHLNTIWQEMFYLPKIFTFLQDREVPILHLVRTDVFAQAVSFLRAQQSGTWHRINGAPEGGNEPIALDPASLEQVMARNHSAVVHMRSTMRHYRNTDELAYEALFTADGGLQAASARKLEGLFGLSVIEGQAPLSKMATRPLIDIIANHPEIRRHFRGSAFESYVNPHLDRH